MLDESNLQVMAEMNLPTNSVFAYDNTINRNHIVASWDNRWHRYVNFTPSRETAWLRAVETPPVSDQLQAVVLQVQTAVPNILALTNKIAAVLDRSTIVLDNAANAASNLNVTLTETRPTLTTARAGRADGLGLGHERQRPVAGRADGREFTADEHGHESDRAAHQSGQRHQQPQRAGAGKLEHVVRHFKNRHGRGRFCSGSEAALAVPLGV
jgi:hypothetical protein